MHRDGDAEVDDARTRWDARWAERAGSHRAPAAFLTDRAALLPPRGRALDVAGGAGRNAVWLATRGFTVTLVDVSPVALQQAQHAAATAGQHLEVVQADLATEPLPEGPFDVVLVHHFLDPAVWRALPGHLAPGGVLLVCQPTVRNLERHPRPSRRFLVSEHAVTQLAAELTAGDAGLELVEATEGWTADGRHEAHLVVRRREAR